MSTKIPELDQIIMPGCEQNEHIAINVNGRVSSAAVFAALWQRVWLCCYGISALDSLPVLSREQALTGVRAARISPLL